MIKEVASRGSRGAHETSHSKILLIQFLQGKKDGAGKTENVEQVAKEEEKEKKVMFQTIKINKMGAKNDDVHTVRISYN